MTIEVLETDSLSLIFSFLDWKEILKARVCRKWKEAATLTPVPQSHTDLGWKQVPDIFVRTGDHGHALSWLSVALPRLPTVTIDYSIGATDEFDVIDGEESEDRMRFNVAAYVPPPPVDLKPLANFRDLQSLTLHRVGLWGKYPFLFQFPYLQKLKLSFNHRLKWDLSDLSGLPHLRELTAVANDSLTGNLKSVRVLRPTLVKLCLNLSHQVEGSLHDFVDFPLLKVLGINCKRVQGDIRKIGPDELPAIEDLDLGEAVYGSDGEYASIAEVASIMLARYHLKKRHPKLYGPRRWRLSDNSPDYYEYNEGHHSRAPPFLTEFVTAGSRIGWRWTNAVTKGSCETIWLDPEPLPGDAGYDEYMEDLDWIQRDVRFYEGFKTPPTEAQHADLASRVPSAYGFTTFVLKHRSGWL